MLELTGGNTGGQHELCPGSEIPAGPSDCCGAVVKGTGGFHCRPSGTYLSSKRLVSKDP